MKPGKINLKQPKYVIPMLILPFILGIGYVFKDMMKEESIEDTLKATNEINIEIPEAHLEQKKEQSKLGALQEAFKKSTDFSSIQAIEEEENEDLSIEENSLYSNEEIRLIDSLNKITRLKEIEIQKQQNDYHSLLGDNGINVDLSEKQVASDFSEETEKRTSRENPAKSKMEEEMELFKAQMRYLDSLQNPKAYITQEPAKEEVVEVEKPIEVVKVESFAANYFNTIGTNRTEKPITAILDETVSVKDGSRIRIRLLDDIAIGEHHLEKGSYIYGNVSGFKAQRVIINISSIMIEEEIIKVNLSIYDNDGQEGFYIPASAFRELTKNIGAQTQSQSISFESGTGGAEEFAYSALEDIYRSTTQAVSKTIRQNKAKLKYSTHVFLINNDNN